MDLLAYDIANADAQPFRVLNPITGDPLGTDKEPVQIWMKSADSAAFMRAKEYARIKAIRTSKSADQIKDADDEALWGMADRLVANDAELVSDVLAAVVTGVDNLDFDGKKVTPKNIGAVLRRLKWLRDDMDAFASDRANFLKPA